MYRVHVYIICVHERYARAAKFSRLKRRIWNLERSIQGLI